MNAAQEYLAARVMTASPATLHLLVVEGAIRHATRAEAALAAGDAGAASTSLTDARAFVTELLGGLNTEAAPEVAGNVASLFGFALRRLAEAELIGPDPTAAAGKVADALRVLHRHRETWRELIALLAGDAAAPAVVVPSPLASIPAPHLPRRTPTGYDDGYQPRSWSG